MDGSLSTKHILALDQGTTSSRAIVFDHAGAVVATAQQEFRQIFPKPGWVEHDAQEIWRTQIEVAAECIARVPDVEVAAIGITNQRETTVVWDRATGTPIANAIVWQDRRTAGICDRLKARKLDRVIRRKTGLVLDAYFSGTKLRWLLDNVPGARAAAGRGELAFGTVDSWLIWNMTRGSSHITDASNASRTLLFDIHTLDWDDELLAILDVPRAMLPSVRSSSEVYGETDAALFGSAVRVAGIAGDQQAALFGQACFEAGSAKNTYGTGCFMLLNTGSSPVPSEKGLLTTVGWRIGKDTTYALEGSVFIAGAAVQWLRDGLKAIEASADVEKLMHQVTDTDGVYLVPAFVGLGAPYWDPRARGTIVGMTRNTTIAHVARAAVDAMAYQTRDVLEVMQDEAGLRLSTLKVDGGAAANAMLLQFQADLLGCPVRRPLVRETTALGAAYLAGLAVGYWDGLDDVRRNWALDREFAPQRPQSDSNRLYAGWKKAVQRSLAWED
jgi:glycerol kinase